MSAHTTDEALEEALQRFPDSHIVIHHHPDDGAWRVSVKESNCLYLPRLGIGDTLAEAIRSLWEDPIIGNRLASDEP
jgi:hypothetical protein